MRLFFPKLKDRRVFQWQEDVDVVIVSALSSTKLCLSFFKILNFSQSIWAKVHYVPEIKLIS